MVGGSFGYGLPLEPRLRQLFISFFPLTGQFSPCDCQHRYPRSPGICELFRFWGCYRREGEGQVSAAG